MAHQQVTWRNASGKQKTYFLAFLAVLGLIVMYKLSAEQTNKNEDHSSSQAILIGAHVETNQGYAGCRQVEDTDKFTALIAAHDTTAALAFIEQTDCQLLPSGTGGTVESNSLWHASVCIRQPGRLFCFWVPEPMVTLSD